MKKYAVLLIALTAIIYVSHYSTSRVSGKPQIAILTPVTHAALDEIISGFTETIQKDLPCSIDVYNAHGDRILLNSLAEKIVNGTYDLALIVATQPSILMKGVITRRKSSLPLVCTAVDDPVSNGLIASFASSGNSITTVTESHDIKHYRKQLQHLKQVLPQIKKLLLVYNPNVMLDKEKDLLNTCCRECAINLTLMPIYAPHEVAQKVALQIPEHDCVILLKDNMIVSCIETLVTICNRLHTPLYASDLNSLAAGATYAYGVHEKQFGIEAARKAYAILHDKKRPSDIASTSVASCTFQVNTLYEGAAT